MTASNQQIRLAKRPTGFPQASDFDLTRSPIPEPGEGQLLVRSLYISVDPYLRGRMRDAKSYAPPIAIGDVIPGGVVGEVIHSHHPDFAPGDIVQGYLGWQAYAVTDGRGLRKINPDLAPISTALGVLGIPGLTAYFGLLDIGRPQAGETVLVSGAAGAVGSLVGQIARIQGCRVVGIAGSDAKVRHIVDELGFDAAFNYKHSRGYDSALQAYCPAGVDVYFDNVGGEITDAVFRQMNVKARIAICGQISQYNSEEPPMGPRILGHLIVKRARVEGFLVSDFSPRFDEGLQQMAKWIQSGELSYREDVVDGVENAPEAFMRMLRGENTGKQLVRAVKDI